MTKHQDAKSQLAYGNAKMNTRLFFFLMFCYQTLLVFQGIDLADTGFYGTFYQQIFNDPQSVSYCFMFWLSGIIGGLFLKILPFAGLLGLRFLWVFVFAAIIILTYDLLKKYISPGYLQISLLLLTLNLNNDPKEFYYNNFSSLLYLVTAILLFNGLKKNRRMAILCSGVVVSLNMFNRFPNILGVGLVLAIIYYGYINKMTVKSVFLNIFSFLAGFLVTTLIILLIMKSLGHLEIYLEALKILRGIGKVPDVSKTAVDSYSIIKLIRTIISHWVISVITAGIVIVGAFVYYALENKFNNLFPKYYLRSVMVKYAIVAIAILLVIFGKINNISILYFLTGLSLIAGCFMIIFNDDTEINLLMFIGIFILLVHPMGSSEGIHTVEIYSLWITFPIAFDRIAKASFVRSSFSLDILQKSYTFSMFVNEKQLKEVKRIVLMLSLIVCARYTYDFPHSDWEKRTEMRYSVNNKHMKGIYTTKERAEILDQVLQASSKYVHPNDYVMAYDCFPLFHFMTETKPYSRNPWPWLYQSNTLKKELEVASANNTRLPVIIMQTVLTLGNGKDWPATKIPQDYSKLPINYDRNEVMEDFIKIHKYQEVWSNGYFKILLPAGKSI